MVHKNQHIQLEVKALRRESSGYYSLVFKRPIGFSFESGDWIDIEHSSGELAGGKTYSISSSPTEPDIVISFREGLSPLKTAMAASKPGDVFYIVQYGNDYGFTLRSKKPSTLIAGGVGIAAFRSMLKELADTTSDGSIKLIYLNKTSDFLFQNELDQWSGALKNLEIIYIPTEGLKRKQREKILSQALSDTNRQFYIAGPPAMVSHTRELLLDTGVGERDIKLDIFGGY